MGSDSSGLNHVEPSNDPNPAQPKPLREQIVDSYK